MKQLAALILAPILAPIVAFPVAAQEPPARPDGGIPIGQECELRSTLILLNDFWTPGGVKVSEEDVRWATEQDDRMKRGEACTMPSTDAAYATEHNTAFVAGMALGKGPQTHAQRLTCAAIWDRWHYAVSSAADPQFATDLRPELSASNARKRHEYWRAEARRHMDAGGLRAPAIDSYRGQAEEQADAIYAAYANNEDGALTVFMENLGTCQ